MSKHDKTKLNYKGELIPWLQRTFRSYDNTSEWRMVPVDDYLLGCYDERLVECYAHPAMLDEHVLIKLAERGLKAFASAPINRIAFPAPPGYRDQDVEPFTSGAVKCNPRDIRFDGPLLTLEDFL